MRIQTWPLSCLLYLQNKYFDYMLSYSPYDNVRAQPYPHILITAGPTITQSISLSPTPWKAYRSCSWAVLFPVLLTKATLNKLVLSSAQVFMIQGLLIGNRRRLEIIIENIKENLFLNSLIEQHFILKYNLCYPLPHTIPRTKFEPSAWSTDPCLNEFLWMIRFYDPWLQWASKLRLERVFRLPHAWRWQLDLGPACTRTWRAIIYRCCLLESCLRAFLAPKHIIASVNNPMPVDYSLCVFLIEWRSLKTSDTHVICKFDLVSGAAPVQHTYTLHNVISILLWRVFDDFSLKRTTIVKVAPEGLLINFHFQVIFLRPTVTNTYAKRFVIKLFIPPFIVKGLLPDTRARTSRLLTRPLCFISWVWQTPRKCEDFKVDMKKEIGEDEILNRNLRTHFSYDNLYGILKSDFRTHNTIIVLYEI